MYFLHVLCNLFEYTNCFRGENDLHTHQLCRVFIGKVPARERDAEQGDSLKLLIERDFMPNWFNERKVAQIAAFFCEKNGGSIAVLKLVKLIYLTDRESMKVSGFPITNDRLVSMPHGPVNSMTYDYISGGLESDYWSDLISAKSNHCVGLARKVVEQDGEELSEHDIDVMNAVWSEFGAMDRWELRNWTHDHCPEWEDPKGGCDPIPHERILKFLNIDCAQEIAAEIADDRRVDSIFSELRG